MSEERTFSELLDAARDGDASARDALFQRLADEGEDANKMLAIARRILPRGDPARDLVESRDLVQSALRDGWSELASFRGGSEAEFLGWLRTILRRRLGRRTRKQQPRIGGIEPVEREDEGEEEDASPTEVALRSELLARVRTEIAALPENQRVVMERRLAGDDASAVAEALGLEAATVRKRESRAMARLREQLAPPR